MATFRIRLKPALVHHVPNLQAVMRQTVANVMTASQLAMGPLLVMT
jgi:hypothetical protein